MFGVVSFVIRDLSPLTGFFLNAMVDFDLCAILLVGKCVATCLGKSTPGRDAHALSSMVSTLATVVWRLACYGLSNYDLNCVLCALLACIPTF